MFQWSVCFFALALVCAVIGFTGGVTEVNSLFRVLFVLFVVLFLVSLVAGLLRP